jgi:hypothetical protein
MEWVHVLTFIVANLAIMMTLFLWLRAESNADRRDINLRFDNFQSQFIRETKDFHKRLEDMHKEFLKETKDFHGRLCSIEERYREKH